MAQGDWQKAVEAYNALKLRIAESEAWRARQARLNEAVAQWERFFNGSDVTTAKQLLLGVERVIPIEWVDLPTAENGRRYVLYILTPTASLQKVCFSTNEARQQVYRSNKLPPEPSSDFALFTCSSAELLAVFRTNNDPEAISKAFRSMVQELDAYADQLLRESQRTLADLERVELETKCR